MSHFGDYMDGVPVKISEKYRRPPTIELPYSVIECPQRAQNVVDSVVYSTTLEHTVLSKLKELRSAKETKKNERKHRLQLLEEAKQRKLDDIAAAEAQEKLKQLSVSEVSYPSTEEISVLAAEDNDANSDTRLSQNNTFENPEVSNTNYPSCSSVEPDPNILQPIQLQAHYPQKSLLDDPDPLQELKNNTKYTKVPMYNNIDSLTFKDFEHDTSSPFDNVELKTINDREQLAQVLQSQGPQMQTHSHESSTSCPQPQAYMTDQIYSATSSLSQPQLPAMSYMPNYMEQSMQTPSVMYTQPPYQMTNGYYTPESICDNTMPVNNVNMYMPNYQYYVPSTPYVVDPNYYNSQIPSATDTLQNGSNYIPQTYYYQLPHLSMQYPPNAYTIPPQTMASPESNHEQASTHTIKSRSRSVADIVKELNTEVMNARERANERLANASPALKPSSVVKSSSSDKKEQKRKKKTEHLPNPFDKLSPNQQVMCKKIQGMGFPLDRVARVCQLVGDNDKKVIESLLILNELMDLGFSEARVAAALAKHEFNRDKALDELV